MYGHLYVCEIQAIRLKGVSLHTRQNYDVGHSERIPQTFSPKCAKRKLEDLRTHIQRICGNLILLISLNLYIPMSKT